MLRTVGQVTSDFFFATCNEPTVGLWYVQENIRTVVPKIVETKVSSSTQQQRFAQGNSQTNKRTKQRKQRAETSAIDSCTYGTDFTLGVVQGLRGLSTFSELVARVRDATRTAELITFVSCHANKHHQASKHLP